MKKYTDAFEQLCRTVKLKRGKKMTIDDKIDIPEQLPLFIKGNDYRFTGEDCWFYYVGIQKGEPDYGIRDVVLYNSDISGSTYSYESIMGEKKRKLRVDTYLEIARKLGVKMENEE